MVIFDRELKDGKLYLKSFLIDTSLNDRGWQVDPEYIDVFANTFIGKPFTIMYNKEESLFKDYHPFYPAPNNPVEKDIEYSEKYAVGHIVDVVPTEQKRLAAQSGGDPKYKSYDAIIEIEDPVVKEELQKENSRLIPPEVSPGIVHFSGNGKPVSEFIGVHLAAVPAGAYGPRAKHIATCEGNPVECRMELLRASSSATDNTDIAQISEQVNQFIPTTSAEWNIDYKLRTGSCPIQALEKLEASSSLVTNPTNLNTTMSFNQPSSFTSGVQRAPMPTIGTATVSGPNGNVLGTQNQTGNRNSQIQTPSQQNKITLKIKNPKRFQKPQEQNKEQATEPIANDTNQQLQQIEKPQEVQAEQPKLNTESLSKDFENTKNEVGFLKRKFELTLSIPHELFLDKNGKFMRKEWEKEVEKRAHDNMPLEMIEEHYRLKSQAQKYLELQEQLNSQSEEKKSKEKKSASSIGALVAQDSSQDTQEQTNVVKLLKLFGGRI